MSIDANRPLFYAFADFRVDAEKHLLWRDSNLIQLTPKVFETLLVFLRHPGEVLEKDRLMEILWPDSFVEESNLTQNVAVLRKALGENSKEHRFILTIPSRGYRFVGDVSVIVDARVAATQPLGTHPIGHGSPVDGETLDPASSTVSSRDKLDRHNGSNGILLPLPSEPFGLEDGRTSDPPAKPSYALKRHLFVAIGVCVLLSGIFAAYFFSTRPAPSASSERNRIAVLPLKPVNVETRDSIYELGIADSVILKISSSRNLVVRPLNAVRKYVELDRDLIEIGKEQNVDFVLASNYQIAGGKIKVTSQLLDVATGKVEDTFTVEKDSTDLFSAQDAIGGAIGSKLIARFGSSSTGYERKRGTNNEEAYRLYLQGMYLTEKYNRKDAARAIETFDEALRLDPTYAAAWAGKSHAHCNFAHRGGSAPIVEFANAEPALDKALELDKNNADAYAVRGIINRDYHWNFAKAYANLDRALELDPNHIFARRIRAGLLTLDGRHDEAIVEIKKAIDLNPSWIWEHWLYAHALIQAKRYDEAIRQSDRVLEMDPDFAAAYSTLWRANHLKGDHLKAYENFLRGKRLSGSSDVDIAKLEAAFRDSGWLGVLRAERDARIAKLESDYSPAKYDIAGFSAVLGDSEGALKYLNECLDNRLIGLSLIKVDPFLDGLRGDPRFEELVRKTGL